MNRSHHNTSPTPPPQRCPTCGSRVACDCRAWRTVYLLAQSTAELLRKLCPSTEVRHG